MENQLRALVEVDRAHFAERMHGKTSWYTHTPNGRIIEYFCDDKGNDVGKVVSSATATERRYFVIDLGE